MDNKCHKKIYSSTNDHPVNSSDIVPVNVAKLGSKESRSLEVADTSNGGILKIKNAEHREDGKTFPPIFRDAINLAHMSIIEKYTIDAGPNNRNSESHLADMAPSIVRGIAGKAVTVRCFTVTN